MNIENDTERVSPYVKCVYVIVILSDAYGDKNAMENDNIYTNIQNRGRGRERESKRKKNWNGEYIGE